jgi:gluconate 2-dehydrogenase gamma chain
MHRLNLFRMSVSDYPTGTVRALLGTEHVSEATRTALQERLDAPVAYTPQFLAPDAFALLEAVASRLLPQPDRPDQPIALAPALDHSLANGLADGWRYDVLPPDREAMRLGLGGIQEIAQALFQADFMALSAEEQDTVLQALADGHPPGPTWQTLNAGRFFEELLAGLTETYYAHPLAQEEIGYVGMADLPAWSKIGLNEKEDREPSEA